MAFKLYGLWNFGLPIFFTKEYKLLLILIGFTSMDILNMHNLYNNYVGQIAKAIYWTVLLASLIPAYAGHVVSLQEAIEVHVYNTRYVREKCLAYENSLLEYDNFKKSLLPSVSFNLTPVSFNRSLRLLQNYTNGEYSNVEEFSNTSSGDLSISQKIAATGGVFSIGSSLNYLREFTSDNNSFCTSPMYFSYSQSLFGGWRNYLFERSISRLKHDMALKNYCASVSTEQQKILT